MRCATTSFGLAITVLFAASPVAAQCTDTDADGYYYEAGCGTQQDCNDASATTHPGAAETCDGRDNNCSGLIDDDDACAQSCDFPDRVGHEITLAPDPGGSEDPSHAWTGSELGVAWSDRRTGVLQVFFARFDASGNRIGSEVQITEPSSHAVSPVLVWNGTEFGLAWTDFRHGDSEIYFARLDLVGQMLGPERRITNAPGTSGAPSLRWNGGGYGLAWVDARGGNLAVRFISLARDGSPQSADQQVSSPGPDAYAPTLEWGISGYALAWRQEYANGEIRFRRIDSVGNLLGNELQLEAAPGSKTTPAMAWTGEEFAVAWLDPEGAKLSRINDIGDPLGTVLIQAASWGTQSAPALTWIGDEFGFFWGSSDGSIGVLRLDSTGTTLSPKRRLTRVGQSVQFFARASWTGEFYVLTWADDRDGTIEARYAKIECECPDGDGDEWTVCQDCDDTSASTFPSAPPTCDGRNNDCDAPGWPLLAGTEESDDDRDFASECGGDCNDGEPAIHPGACDGLDDQCQSAPNEVDSDEDGVRLCDGDCDDDEPAIHPGAAEECNWRDDDCSGFIDGPECDGPCDGNGTMGSEVRVTRSIGYETDSHAGWQDLAWNGSVYGMVWHAAYSGSERFRTVDRLGRTVAGPIQFGPTESNSPLLVSVLWNGSSFAVAWSPNWATLHLSKLKPDGTRESPDTVAYSRPSPYVSHPSLAWTGSQYGLAFDDYFEGTMFVRLDVDGNPIAEPTVVATDASYGPSLSWTGESYAIAWPDHRDGNGEIYLARLDPDGQRIGGDVRVTVATGESSLPKLVWDGAAFGLAWIDERSGTPELYFARLDANGNRIGAERQIGDVSYSWGEGPTLDWTGSEYRIGWSDYRTGQATATVIRLDGDGAPLGPPKALESGDSRSSMPVSRWSGQESGVFFMDDRVGTNEVFFIRWGSTCVDGDGDGASGSDDCNDTDASVFPGATESCDGLANDCRRVGWPGAPSDEADGDGDGSRVCAGDCNDSEPLIHPAAPEICNGIDDNCNSQIDDDSFGVDSDSDGVRNACDNCRFAFNPSQLDSDGDQVGNSCDNCALLSNANQADTDSDQRGDTCDNCPTEHNPFQDDFDDDRAGDACDNCVFDFDTSQSDFDQDNQGDVCDLDDGLILVVSTDRNYREWQPESGYTTWNSYRGSLTVLRATGQYTQAPSSNPLAARDCGLVDPYVFDDLVPDPGEVAFNLVTGVASGIESSLGANSGGVVRANENPCP